MIVNPQLFNYRLIISSLIVTIAVLAVFSFTNYQSNASNQEFLKQEKKLVESEFSQMLLQYNDVAERNISLSTQIIEAKRETKIALDSLRLLNSDLSVITKFKRRLITLKSKNVTLFSTIDSLTAANKTLQTEKQLAVITLKEQRALNNILIEENSGLNKTIESASLLIANSFKATAHKNNLGKKINTNIAARANAIDVCFTLAKNILTEPGKKEIYIQIVNPKNNVVADKGAVNFGRSSLIYSIKTIITYNNEVKDVCVEIKADKDNQPFAKGTYFVSVFYKDRKLGSTEVVLN